MPNGVEVRKNTFVLRQKPISICGSRCLPVQFCFTGPDCYCASYPICGNRSPSLISNAHIQVRPDGEFIFRPTQCVTFSILSSPKVGHLNILTFRYPGIKNTDQANYFVQALARGSRLESFKVPFNRQNASCKNPGSLKPSLLASLKRKEDNPTSNAVSVKRRTFNLRTVSASCERKGCFPPFSNCARPCDCVQVFPTGECRHYGVISNANVNYSSRNNAVLLSPSENIQFTIFNTPRNNLKSFTTFVFPIKNTNKRLAFVESQNRIGNLQTGRVLFNQAGTPITLNPS
ncbi:hypothetical protein SAMN05444972_110160 [Marininema halotolerans]|uniref:Uncharacterized protein n=1 Tax=Marininema halotolerans TaxID=1155944 RepID=A0A1I6TND6_9BACL|nr:hypothetical protein SAMN05444972_110160 [Marininema halotolerans]